jgi:hypothetical protein
MSALDRLAVLLTGAEPAGVHQWPAAVDLEEVRRTVEHSGWRYRYAAGPPGADRQQAMLAIGVALGFPSYFTGRSLDALHDCLRDLESATVLVWEGWGGFADRDPEGFRGMCRVLAHRDEGDPALEILLRGAAAEFEPLA